MDGKHCAKRRICSLRAVSPIPAVFSKVLYCRHIKNQGLFGKGLTDLVDDFIALLVLSMAIQEPAFRTRVDQDQITLFELSDLI